jgi:hypothetical protein
VAPVLGSIWEKPRVPGLKTGKQRSLKTLVFFLDRLLGNQMVRHNPDATVHFRIGGERSTAARKTGGKVSGRSGHWVHKALFTHSSDLDHH